MAMNAMELKIILLRIISESTILNAEALKGLLTSFQDSKKILNGFMTKVMLPVGR